MNDSIENLESWDVLVGRVKDRWDRALIRIVSYSDAPKRFAAGAKLCAEKNGQRRLLEIEISNSKAGYYVCGVGLTSSEDADSLVGAQLFVHRSMRPKLPTGQFYPDEFIGMRIETEEGEDLGEVEEVLETPHHEVYVTSQAMIPAVPEFVVRVDSDAQRIIVRAMEGLKTS